MPDIRPLSPELAKKAKEELGETPEKIEQGLEAFRAWLAKSPHIKGRTDDQFLVTFLRGCKYSLERAKEKYDLYYTLRNAIPEVYKERHPRLARVQEIMKLGLLLPLPETEAPDSPRVILFRGGVVDYNKYTILETVKVTTMIFEIMMREDDNLMIAGQLAVQDLSGCGVPMFVQATPTNMKRFIAIGQDSAPVREKGSHFIHFPTAFYHVFNLFKTFLSEKSKQRLTIHADDFEGLFKIIPKRLFPTEYGGEAGSCQSIVDHWCKKLDEYADYFEEEELQGYGTDEKKRIGRPKNAESLFGLEGSFRQLQID